MSGPAQWTQPVGLNDISGSLVINGTVLEVVIPELDVAQPEAGVFVETAGGQHVHHGTLESADAPVSLGPLEVELEVQAVSEDQRALLAMAPALAKAGRLQLWFDHWITDVWVGDGSKTTFGLSRSTGYGSTGVSWADRPARSFVYDGAGGVTELTMVTAAPGAGECQLSQTADATQIVVGTAPGAGEFLTLRYYPVMQGAAGSSFQLTDYNNGRVGLEFREAIPWRAYPW